SGIVSTSYSSCSSCPRGTLRRGTCPATLSPCQCPSASPCARASRTTHSVARTPSTPSQGGRRLATSCASSAGREWCRLRRSKGRRPGEDCSGAGCLRCCRHQGRQPLRGRAWCVGQQQKDAGEVRRRQQPAAAAGAGDDPQILVTGGTPTKVSYGDVMEDVPWSDSWGQDASFYNMADGACLYQWEYGILIGFGFTLVFGAGSLFAGWVCDRRSRVVVASASLMVMSVATALQASAHSFLYLLVFRAIIGLAQAFAMPAAISILSDYFVEKQKVAVGVLSVGLYLGSGCASFSLLFAMALGWRWAVLLAGLVGIALAPVLYHTVKEPERTIFNAPCNLQ
ncbi:unnamed protein product, partial [Prorocentrum cordatum]